MSETDNEDNEPITLEAACEIIFRNAITPATLRAEWKRGRLELERIGRRDFVTRAAIREMRRKCRQAPSQKDQDSGSSPNGQDKADRQRHLPGPSETTEDLNAAFRSALTTAAALRKRSKTTSPKNTQSLPANVVPLRG